MATVFDADGRPLTAVTARPEQGSRVILAEVESSAALLRYVFGRGERRVMVELGGRLVDGSIDTCWQGADRLWWLDVEAPVIVTGLSRTPAEAVEAAGPIGEPSAGYSLPVMV